MRHSFDGASRPGNLTRRHELIGGHFYPLNVGRALDFRTSRKYVERAVQRALREPSSARNLAAESQVRARARQVRREQVIRP